MTSTELLNKLEGVRPRGPGKWSAQCPAHDDRSPSLSLCEDQTKILVHCFSGCTAKEIVEAMGVTMADLFIDRSIPQNQRAILSPQKIDPQDEAFRFELGALDRRLRSERVMQAVQGFHPDELTDQQLDRLLNVIAGAYSDANQAQSLEAVADDLRLKAYQERMARHAA